MSLYATDGSFNVTVVDGSTYTGIHAADGSYNVVLVDGTAYTGVMHPCGAYNIFLVTEEPDTPASAHHPCGAYNASESPYIPGTMRITRPFDSYLLFDDFSGTSGELNGRTPDKGSDWVATGGAADVMIAGDGVLTQSEDIVDAAGYAFNNLGETPKKITADWSYASGTVDLPPTLAITKDTGGMGTDFIHGQMTTNNFYLTLGNETGPTFKEPSWVLNASNYSLTAETDYTTELHYDGNKMVAMVLKNGEGSVIGQSVTYDMEYPDFIGNYIFAETFNTRLQYSKITAEDSTTYSFPTLDVLKETTFSEDADGFVAGPFGGSVSWSSGVLTIDTTGAYGTGGAVPIGALEVGDVLTFFVHVTNKSTGAFVLTAADGSGPVGDIVPLTLETGNIMRYDVNITTASAAASFLIAGDGTSTSISIDRLTVIKNAPTSF